MGTVQKIMNPAKKQLNWLPILGLLPTRAETIPRVTRIQKNHWGKLCASKNRFVHLLGMHWIFGSRKYMPLRTVQQCSGYSPSSVITAPCDAPLYHSAQLPLMLTGKAESAQITRWQERSIQESILVAVCSRAAVLWHAVLLIWATLVKISFTNLILLPAVLYLTFTTVRDAKAVIKSEQQ